MKPDNTVLRVSLILTSGFISLLFLSLIILLNIDWNRVKPWLNARTSEALGRPFSIRGNLVLTWKHQDTGLKPTSNWRNSIPWPYLLAQDIHIGQPPDIAQENKAMQQIPTGDMVHINELSFSLDPLALLGKKITIPLIRFQGSSLSLQRFANGTNNWTLPKNTQASSWQLELRKVVFSQGRIHFTDAIRQADITTEIESVNTETGYGIKWTLKGKLHDEEINGDGKAGAILSLQQQDIPFPLTGRLQTGNTKIFAEGSLTKPNDLAALDMHLQVSGISMARLYALTGIVFPETPAYAIAGHLTATLGKLDRHWIYDNFKGKAGSSDIAGSLEYQTRKSRQLRPLLTGKIVSQKLQLDDLAPLIGADSNAGKIRRGAPAVQPGNKLLPVEAFRAERWRTMDADVILSADKLMRQKELPIRKLETRLLLKDGVISMLPVSIDLAGGQIQAHITLDGNGTTLARAIRAEMRVVIRHLQLQRLFPALTAPEWTLGEINADAKLSATGNSVASMLGTANGDISSLTNRGSISKLLLEKLGLNIGNIVLISLAGDKQIHLNCIFSDFSVAHGQMNIRSFLIDTDEALITVTGSIDMLQEQLNLTIKPDSKTLRILSLRAPVYVRGSFLHPQVSVNKTVVAIRAGGAIALALLSPFAALLPLINTGPMRNGGCTALSIPPNTTNK
ncbi:AsmA family protein [Undibacterium sp. SXout7W]|uniref:AsmA family protein n=1 Tax=Undibacterium sp. SXout7W TaxID=3413049 RepID=UPI003BF04950